MLKEAEQIIRLLDENCSENREIEDMVEYIAILESKEDVAEIKANSIKSDDKSCEYKNLHIIK